MWPPELLNSQNMFSTETPSKSVSVVAHAALVVCEGLADAVERLKLAARAPVQLREMHDSVHLRDDRRRPAVAVGVDGRDLLVAGSST